MTFLDDYDRKVADIIAEHGVFLQGVFPTKEDPPGPVFVYTVGLTLQNHPELIEFGLPYKYAGHILNDLAARVHQQGQTLEPYVEMDDEVADYPAKLIPVLDSTEHLTMANRFFAEMEPAGEVSAYQLVYPDAGARWPWDPGYSLNPVLQPLLGLPPP